MLKIENLILKTGEYELFTTEEIILKKGEKFLFVGENNSGKSLFLKSLHKTYFNHNGNFKIKKDNFLQKKKKESILIDNTINLISEKTIYKNIVLPLKTVNETTKTIIQDLCDIAKLGEIYSADCSKISFSQAKKIEIIRAVLVNPYLILIDDLDNFFDDINLNLIFDVLKNSQTDSIIIATSKRLLDNFDYKYRIQNQKMVKL